MKCYKTVGLLTVSLAMNVWLHAGVRGDIQDLYIQNYENKAMFLKVPIRGTRQIIHVRVSQSRLDSASITNPLHFKVGDQVRITEVNFRGDSVRFKISSLDLTQESELEFRFRQDLQDHFPQRGAFDITLRGTLTEGLSYTDIESARQEFIDIEFQQFVQQLSLSSNIPPESVATVLRDKITDYQALKLETEKTQKTLQKTEDHLQQEIRTRLQVEAEVSRLETSLNQVQSDLAQLENEREILVAETERLNEDYENKIKGLIETLDINTSSSASMEAQVDTLSESIGVLQTERLTRTREIQDLKEQLSELKETTRVLSEDLGQAQTEKEKLRDNFSILTSDRRSLEGRYASLVQENEQFQNAALLDNAFSLEWKIQHREEKELRVADLYLLTQQIGTMEMALMPIEGVVHPVRFTAASPNTVKFSLNERRILELLGEPFKIETTWETRSDNLQIVLLDKNSIQSVSPRETIEWPWMFQGKVTQPEPASLSIHLISSNGTKIFLDSQDTTVSSAQMITRLRYSMSPMSLLIGTIVGILVCGIVLRFRKHSKIPPQTSGQAPLVIHKKL